MAVDPTNWRLAAKLAQQQGSEQQPQTMQESKKWVNPSFLVLTRKLRFVLWTLAPLMVQMPSSLGKLKLCAKWAAVICSEIQPTTCPIEAFRDKTGRVRCVCIGSFSLCIFKIFFVINDICIYSVYEYTKIWRDI